MREDTILVLDMGSRFSQSIARRVREQKVFAEIWPAAASAETVRAREPIGIIISSGPVDPDGEPPRLDPAILSMGLPVLGIGAGAHAMVRELGGKLRPPGFDAGGRQSMVVTGPSRLFDGLALEQEVWLTGSGDRIGSLPRQFHRLGKAGGACPSAAVGDDSRGLYAIQFHPEAQQTALGREIFHNFLYKVCGARGLWEIEGFVEESIRRTREQVGSGRVVLGLSGGVDSTVVAMLLDKAIGPQLTCVFVDHGLLRQGEYERVTGSYRQRHALDVRGVRAGDRFFGALAGVSEPEEKRKIIGRLFVEIFEEEAKQIEAVRFLAQGTVYPDVIESMGVGGVIKSHHNVGGLPERLGLELVEPLRELFKDEVRMLGLELGLHEAQVWRHPFPGPGLAVRCVGEVTPDRVATLRAADQIVMEEIHRAGLYRQVWQAFAVLLPVKTVGMRGDKRTYENPVVLRVVDSQDGMTADWTRVPAQVLDNMSRRILAEVPGVNRVALDISAKPPSTIEWE